MSYEVTTPVFTGPFDLLLHLITKRQVEIYEINLAEIVDAYVAEIEQMQEVNLEVATEFLLIAATLIELKSTRLLPSGDEVEIDEECSLFERRDLLIARILDAKAFKDASKAIHERLLEGMRFAPRVAGIEERFVDICPDLLGKVTPEDLAQRAVKLLISHSLPKIETDHIHKIEINVGEVMKTMAEEIEIKRRSTFRELTSRCGSRLEIAIHFLAMLELFKQNMIDIEQFTTFGEITVIWAPLERFLDWDVAGAEWEDDFSDEAPVDEAVGKESPGTDDRIPVAPEEIDSYQGVSDLLSPADGGLAEEPDRDDDTSRDEDLFDRSLLDNSDLLKEAEDLLSGRARWPRRHDEGGNISGR